MEVALVFYKFSAIMFLSFVEIFVATSKSYICAVLDIYLESLPIYRQKKELESLVSVKNSELLMIKHEWFNVMVKVVNFG